MPLNFCFSDLVSITSSATSFENYELKNLVAQVGAKAHKGYLADYFCKPPVSVDLKFICNVNISFILIKNCVGSQKSVSFEVSTKSFRGNGKVAVSYDTFNFDYIIFHKFGDDTYPSEWNKLNKCLKVAFYCPYRLKNVEEVHIRITKTLNSSVPCLGRLEVWGDPSKSIPRTLSEEIYAKWKNYQNSVLEISQKYHLNKDSVPPPEKTFKKIENFDMIPEEFLDPITCDIMLFPVLLPCGKNVDQSTLDKFYKAEEQLGRGHSDPFTGLLFSNKRKPLLNTMLKSKIDKYLVNHCNSEIVKNMPRILGKPPVSCIPGLMQATSVETRSITNFEPYSTCANKPESCSSHCSNSKRLSVKTTKRSLDELLEDSLYGLPSYLEVKVPKLS